MAGAGFRKAAGEEEVGGRENWNVVRSRWESDKMWTDSPTGHTLCEEWAYLAGSLKYTATARAKAFIK